MNQPQNDYQDGTLIKIGKFIGLGLALFMPQLTLLLPKAGVTPVISWTAFALSYFLLYSLYLYFFRKYRTTIPQVLDRRAWLTILAGYLVMSLAKIVFVSLNVLVSKQETTSNDQALFSLTKNSNHTFVTMTVAMVVFFAPLAEELLFRGILMNMFFKHRFWLSVILSAVIFGLAHSNSTWTGSLIYIVLGGILAFIYKRTNNLKITIVLHFLNNLPFLLSIF